MHRGGFRGGFGSRGRGNPSARGRGGSSFHEWIPVTRLGREVKAGLYKTFDDILRHSLPIKEVEIVDFYFDGLEEKILNVSVVQKQCTAGQRSKYKVIVGVGDGKGHVGIGSKCSTEVSSSIRGAILLAKLAMVPVRKGHWGNKSIGEPHTVPFKVTGKCGSVLVRLLPAPPGTGIVAAPVPKAMLELAGVQDVYSTTSGSRTVGNFAMATYLALRNSWTLLTPDLWNQAEDSHF